MVLPPDVVAEVLTVHAKNSNTRFIFWSGEGEPGAIVKSYQKYHVAPCFKAAGLHEEGFMVSHRLRDTFAVEMLASGASLESVSKPLGHKSIKTTERSYAVWVVSRQAQLDAQVMAA